VNSAHNRSAARAIRGARGKIAARGHFSAAGKGSASILETFPKAYRADIERAVQILREGGCQEVHVFGSVAEGRIRKGSDLNLAVRGCPPRNFFPLLGRSKEVRVKIAKGQ